MEKDKHLAAHATSLGEQETSCSRLERAEEQEDGDDDDDVDPPAKEEEGELWADEEEDEDNEDEPWAEDDACSNLFFRPVL